MSKINLIASIKPYRKQYAVYVGLVRLSKLFKTEEEAKANYEAKKSFYDYWAGSASVSVDNSPYKILGE